MKPKQRSRVVVGFHRLGTALAVPFLLIAAVLAFMQWQNPTGRVVTNLPKGAVAWNEGIGEDQTADQIIAKQRKAGFDLPAGFMLVGIPLGTVQQDGSIGQSIGLRTGVRLAFGRWMRKALIK
jgi:hypothetical protein